MRYFLRPVLAASGRNEVDYPCQFARHRQKQLHRSDGIMSNMETEAGPKEQIELSTTQTARAGWEEQFKKMVKFGDDQQIDNALLISAWDEEDWEWFNQEEQPPAKT